MSGDLLVDNILMSNYALIKSHTLAHNAMAPARWWYAINNNIKEYLPDSVTASFMIEKQLNGTHWYPEALHAFNSFTNVVKFN